MRGHAIRRGTSVVVGATLLVGVGLAPGLARASGGGGCGRGVTDDRGMRIGIRNFCFGPTILRVRPGETVTWVNRDGFAHTVLGANAAWGGFESLRGNGGEVSYRFVRSGVYPYVCTYHPGMVGAVVVGNGKGAGAAHTVTTSVGPVTLATPPVAEAEPVTSIEQSSGRVEVPSASWPAAVGWGIGLMLVIAATLALHRRHRVPAP